MTQTTITQVQGMGHYDGQYGRMFKYTVSLADGVEGEASSKSQPPPWKEGDTVWYEVTGEFRGTPRLKLSKQDPNAPRGGFTGGGARASDPHLQARIDASWALGQAIQWNMAACTPVDSEATLMNQARTLLRMRDALAAIPPSDERP